MYLCIDFNVLIVYVLLLITDGHESGKKMMIWAGLCFMGSNESPQFLFFWFGSWLMDSGCSRMIPLPRLEMPNLQNSSLPSKIGEDSIYGGWVTVLQEMDSSQAKPIKLTAHPPGMPLTLLSKFGKDWIGRQVLSPKAGVPGKCVR